MLIGVELLVWWMISWQQAIFTFGVVNVLTGVAWVWLYYMRDHDIHVPHLHHFWKQYGWTSLVCVWCWVLLKLLLIQQWLYETVILTTLITGCIILEWKILPLRRWRSYIASRSILWVLSLMVVAIIFQKHRVVESPWLIVVAFGWGWLVYAIGLLISKPTLRDPLLITRWLLTIIAWLRASTTVLIAAYEDRKIETIIYQEKEVYLPAQQCLPDWGSISLVQE